jgi:hypothetical protein
VGLERGPLSLVSTTEELLGRKSSSSGLENREHGRKGSVALTTRHPSICKSWHIIDSGTAASSVSSHESSGPSPVYTKHPELVLPPSAA